jgi:phenylalanyl-tRNA synthetase beta chain
MLDAIPQPKTKNGPQRPPLKASSYQPVERDFAFLVASEVPADKLIRAAKSVDRTLIQNVSLFDLYEGDRIETGKKSVAISVTLQPSDRTLTDAEIEQVSQKIVAAVMKTTGAVLRS